MCAYCSSMVALLVALLCSPALAGYRVDAQSIEIGDWRFIPIVEVDDDNPTNPAAPAEVHSFVALLNPTLIEGDLIAAIWYARDPAQPTGWDSVAWDTQDQWAVFGFVQGYLNMPESDADNWESDQPRPQTIASAGVPKKYYRGMLDDDPINQQVGNDPARDALVELLVDVTHKAANVEVDKESIQRAGLLLDAMGEGIKAGRQGLDPIAAFDGAIAGIIPLCFESTWVTVPASPWSAPPAAAGWVLDHQQNANGACLNCWYRRIYAVSQTRTVTHRDNDCGYTVCNQTRTKWVNELGFVACAFVSGVCPTVFAGTPTITDTSTSVGDWTPSCP